MSRTKEVVHSARDFSRHQLTLRVVIALAPLLIFAAGWLAGARPHPAATTVVLLLLMYGAFAPDSQAALFLMSLMAIGWFFYVDDPGTPWAILAAVGILILHSATALATSAPTRADFEPTLWAVWVRRTLLVAVSAVAVWAATVGFATLDAPGSLILSATGVFLVAVLAVILRKGSVAHRPD